MTLILMAFMLTAMIGVSAFAVDFGRMYLFRAQLHSAADAAALAGTFRVSQPHLDRTDARDTAISYATRAILAGGSVGLAANDVIPGSWTSAGGFVPDPALDWNSSTVDAVQATARYTGSFIFGRFFGMTNRPVSATAVAVRGSVASATCVRPWAVPYQLMLNELAAAFGGGPPQDANTYELTPDDVVHLGQLTMANNIDLKVGDQSAVITNGNFYGVKLPPIEYANGTPGTPWNGGANTFETAESANCATLTGMMAPGSPVISQGDWLAPENGNMQGPTQFGITGQGNLAGLCGSITCSPAVQVTVALWNQSGNAPDVSGCGGKCFKVKYLGVFYVTGYNTVTNAVTGYFSTMSASGAFSPTPGPIQTIALVK
jgi:hypothetical protein